MSVTIIGTLSDDVLESAQDTNTIVGLSGDDTLIGKAGDDLIIGDFIEENLLTGSDTATSFAQFETSSAWTVNALDDGHSEMTQSVQTVSGAAYTVSFEAAANIGEGYLTGAVEVLWNGEVVGTVDTAEAGFSGFDFDLIGTGGQDALTFRSVESTSEPSGPTIYTDTPIYYYEKEVEVSGQTVTVRAVAPGQPNLYQVMNGTLNVFDVESQSYTQAGADATVVINGFGFNQEDDLFYGIAVKDGLDSLGNVVQKTDIMMIDAEGNSYRMGEGPYASWTGDFDDKGNLWSFHSSMDRVTVIDVDQLDEAGNPLATVYKFPKELVTDSVWDVAFDASTQKFYGVVKPSSEGASGKLMIVDTQGVADGGDPSFSTVELTGTWIGGVLRDGLPAITFGASIVDGDGNLYVGGNGGDHDMDDSTATSGGIYRVNLEDGESTGTLELVTEAPKAYSNDGAADPRSVDPFMERDPGAKVLIRSPELVATVDPSTSYNDTVEAGGGRDDVYGGFGEDLIIGASLGDELHGDEGDDALYGGAGPDASSSTISFYDEAGLRYDQYGNLLPEDDDILFGGAGDDLMSGSAGHDTLDGGEGNDQMTGGTGLDVMYGGAGQDNINGGRENDILYGGSGADLLDGGSGDDQLFGEEDADSIYAGSGDDTVNGGEGDDTIDAGSGNDQVSGGDGNDRIKSGSGADVVTAGEGDDYVNASHGDDFVDGGSGKDTIYLGAGNDVAWGGDGSDRFVFRFEDLDGSEYVIHDFARDATGLDRLDFRQLDLLSGGITADAWIAENVVQNISGDVTIQLGGLDLVLMDHKDLDEVYLAEVTDGFVF